MSDDLRQVQLWHVQGIIGTYYETKQLAEKAAWVAFPEEIASARYARLYVKTFYKEVR